jgi:hypothetical protein
MSYFFLHLYRKKQILSSIASLVKLFAKKCLVELHQKIKNLKLIYNLYQTYP